MTIEEFQDLLTAYHYLDARVNSLECSYFADEVDFSIELYDDFEDNKLIFFEQSMESLMSIELTDADASRIYYYEVEIAKSLEEFLQKMIENDLYYMNIFEVERRTFSNQRATGRWLAS